MVPRTPARFLWFFEWPAFALTHGHSVLGIRSGSSIRPASTSSMTPACLLSGLVLTPVTLSLRAGGLHERGPDPGAVPSRLAMFALLRRWVHGSRPPSSVGLVFGFSPFLITELALNQLNIAFIAIPPLVVIALDELLIRQRRSPYRLGAGLAALLGGPILPEHRGTGHHRSVRSGRRPAASSGFVTLRQPGAVGPRVNYALQGSITALGRDDACLGLSPLVPPQGSRTSRRPDLVHRLALPVREHTH